MIIHLKYLNKKSAITIIGTMDNGIEKIVFNTTTICEQPFNVNQDLENDPLAVLNNFEDLIPYYDEESGICLNLRDKEVGSKASILGLSATVSNNMVIPGSDKMDDETYLKTFCELKANHVKGLINGVYARGYQTPSIVQSISLLPIIQGRDTIIQFKSGTGKTLAFILGALWHFDLNDRELQHVFITSSHEVAKQLHSLAVELLPNNANVVLCVGQKKEVGGFSDDNRSNLKKELDAAHNAQVIVCTLGKFYDFLTNRKVGRNPVISLKFLKTIAIDEFDGIIGSQGRRSSSSSMTMTSDEQIRDIFETRLSETTQRIFFSATTTEVSLTMAYGYFRNEKYGQPYIVVLDADDYTLEGIKHFYVKVPCNEEKMNTLKDLTEQIRIAQTIIFVNRITTANMLKDFLQSQQIPFPTAVFHRDLTENEREDIRQKMINNQIRVLISTDVLARGFDLQSVNIVFNYDMPDQLRTYIHRVGRSGRYGRKGLAISFVEVNPSRNVNEMAKVNEINECSKKSQLEELPEDITKLT